MFNKAEIPMLDVTDAQLVEHLHQVKCLLFPYTISTLNSEAAFKCGQCNVAQFAVLRTISHNFLYTAYYRKNRRSSHILAQFISLHNVLHNFMYKNPSYKFRSYSEFYLRGVDPMT
jgi:hypothetical protein